MSRPQCGGYWSWTEECRKPGCEECGTLLFELEAPKGCICPTTLAGFVLIAQRDENCPEHGRCQCTSGPMQYDDHRECDYVPRKWAPKCPLRYHRQDE